VQEIEVDKATFFGFDRIRHLLIKGNTTLVVGDAKIVSDVPGNPSERANWVAFGGQDQRPDNKIEHQVHVYKIVTQVFDDFSDLDFFDINRVNKVAALGYLKGRNQGNMEMSDTATIIYFEPQ